MSTSRITVAFQTWAGLPLDIVYAIAQTLDTSEVWNFSRTCRSVRDISRPFCYRKAKLSSPKKLESFYEFVRTAPGALWLQSLLVLTSRNMLSRTVLEVGEETPHEAMLAFIISSAPRLRRLTISRTTVSFAEGSGLYDAITSSESILELSVPHIDEALGIVLRLRRPMRTIRLLTGNQHADDPVVPGQPDALMNFSSSLTVLGLQAGYLLRAEGDPAMRFPRVARLLLDWRGVTGSREIVWGTVDRCMPNLHDLVVTSFHEEVTTHSSQERRRWSITMEGVHLGVAAIMSLGHVRELVLLTRFAHGPIREEFMLEMLGGCSSLVFLAIDLPSTWTPGALASLASALPSLSCVIMKMPSQKECGLTLVERLAFMRSMPVTDINIHQSWSYDVYSEFKSIKVFDQLGFLALRTLGVLRIPKSGYGYFPHNRAPLWEKVNGVIRQVSKEQVRMRRKALLSRYSSVARRTQADVEVFLDKTLA